LIAATLDNVTSPVPEQDLVVVATAQMKPEEAIGARSKRPPAVPLPHHILRRPASSRATHRYRRTMRTNRRRRSPTNRHFYSDQLIVFPTRNHLYPDFGVHYRHGDRSTDSGSNIEDRGMPALPTSDGAPLAERWGPAVVADTVRTQRRP